MAHIGGLIRMILAKKNVQKAVEKGIITPVFQAIRNVSNARMPIVLFVMVLV
jgi:hypothetical protein